MHGKNPNDAGSSEDDEDCEEFDRQPSRDPDQLFDVKRLMCLGILYCHSKDPIERVIKFYELLQVNLEDFVCVDDDEIDKYVQFMAKLSDQLGIALYNSHNNSKFPW